MSSVHAQSETHACAQCGATYSRFRGLRRHLLAKHGKKVKKIKDDLIDVTNQAKVMNEVQNSEIKVQNGQMEKQISEIVRNKMDAEKMAFLDDKNSSVVRTTDGAVFMTPPIII